MGGTDAVLAARLESISNDLRAIADLRNDVRELRASIEALTARVDGLLKSSDEQIANHREDTEPASIPEGGSETEIQESDNGLTLIEAEVVRLELSELGTE